MLVRRGSASPRTPWRLVGALATALAAGLLAAPSAVANPAVANPAVANPAVANPAAANPAVGKPAAQANQPAAPSPAQVLEQQQEAARLTGLANAQAGHAERARAELAILAQHASVALEEHDIARAAAAAATQRAVAARQREVAAREQLSEIGIEVEQARTELGRYAAAAYRDGGSAGPLGPASALLDSGDVADLGRRMAVLQYVGTAHARALDHLERVEAAQAAATQEAAEASAQAATEEARAADERAKAAAAKARADALVADQQLVLAALEAVENQTRDAAATAAAVAARMDQARRVAEQRSAEDGRQRAADIAAGYAVVPLGGCVGADVSQFPNGEIPRSALCPLWGAAGHALRADAAAAFNAMSKAYARDWGRPICVTDSYRTYEMQVDLKRRKPFLAARPGTSNHGWGRAVDLCDGVNVFDTPTYTWMKQNAPRYGWYHPSWAEPTGSKPEAWHWEFGR